MRNMSFMLTKEQILARTKTVTRRLGWKNLKAGHILQPVEKGMGLRKGERVVKLGGPIVVTKVRREMLNRIMISTIPLYGQNEMVLEGFPGMEPDDFVSMFCKTHRGSCPTSTVTRIEFEYV